MKKNIKNLTKIFSFSFVFMFVLFHITTYVFADIIDNTPPEISDITPIIVRVIDILLVSAGGVLVVMVAYGVWKSSLATGDPRGLEGAKSTWSHALYGFFIVVGAFALIVIVSGVIGVSSKSGGWFPGLSNSINELLQLPPTEGGLPQPPPLYCEDPTKCCPPSCISKTCSGGACVCPACPE
jgi:hypothetical protein